MHMILAIDANKPWKAWTVLAHGGEKRRIRCQALGIRQPNHVTHSSTKLVAGIPSGLGQPLELGFLALDLRAWAIPRATWHLII